jgi:thymidylate synthase
MYVNRARTVSEALHNGLHAIRVNGVAKPSRVGDVLVMPRPVLTEYEDPTNRVLFSPIRDANPFFHVMETLWMLAGRNDLPWLVRFNKRFASYSDDGGQTQPGAYGYRWRNYFGHDQLMDVIIELKQNPDSRRVVLTMWDSGSRATWDETLNKNEVPIKGFAHSPELQPGDFYAAISGSADVPCNTHAYFDTIDGRLNMTVCCRSNDIIWGAYGANAVHFSFLLEYLSVATGIPMGVYRQFSNNFHLYTNIVPREQLMPLARDAETSDKYLMYETPNALTRIPAKPALRKIPLMVDHEQFDYDLHEFMEKEHLGNYEEPFFRYVAAPMIGAHLHYREKRYTDAIDLASTIRAEDWRIACMEWLNRRLIKHEQNKRRWSDIVPTVQEEPSDNLMGVEDRSHV